MDPSMGSGNSGGAGAMLKKLFRGGEEDIGLWQDREIRRVDCADEEGLDHLLLRLLHTTRAACLEPW